MNSFERILPEIDKGIATIKPLMQGDTRIIAESQIIGLEEAKKIVEKYKHDDGWIPCSEQLPDNYEHDWVLAQVQEDNGYLWIPKVMEYRQSKDDWYLDSENGGWLKERYGGAFKVVAWMPLPEPYKESKNDERI